MNEGSYWAFYFVFKSMTQHPAEKPLNIFSTEGLDPARETKFIPSRRPAAVILSGKQKDEKQELRVFQTKKKVDKWEWQQREALLDAKVSNSMQKEKAERDFIRKRLERLNTKMTEGQRQRLYHNAIEQSKLYSPNTHQKAQAEKVRKGNETGRPLSARVKEKINSICARFVL